MLGVGDTTQLLLKARAQYFPQLCSVNKGVREPCLADPYHLKSKACRRQIIKIKQPYIENGIEPKFSMSHHSAEGVCVWRSTSSD